MNTLPYTYSNDHFPHLTAWFRYRSSRHGGYKRLQHLFEYNGEEITAEDYSPLTTAEEQRWLVLERRAKQENLSGRDSAEYEILLEIKLYNRYRSTYPQLDHESLVTMVKQLL